MDFAGVEVDDVRVSTGAGSTSFEDDGDTLDGWTVPGAPEGSAANANDWIVGTSADTPTSTGELADRALERQPDAIAFLSDLFGPYPFVAAGGIVDDKRDLGFALETQTRPVYARDFFENRSGPPNSSVIVHELAHQWAGDYLAVAAWQHIWLNEGFASYTEWLWSEREGEATAQEIFDAVTSIPADDPFWSLTIGDPGPDQLFESPVYDRGAATLHALRLQIGDDDFFRLLRRWVRRHAGGNVTTAQFTRTRRARLRARPRCALRPSGCSRPRGPRRSVRHSRRHGRPPRHRRCALTSRAARCGCWSQGDANPRRAALDDDAGHRRTASVGAASARHGATRCNHGRTAAGSRAPGSARTAIPRRVTVRLLTWAQRQALAERGPATCASTRLSPSERVMPHASG